MKEFVVRWRMEVDADAAQEAASSALEMLRSANDWDALIFQVTCPDGSETEVDLARDPMPERNGQ